MLKVDLHSHSIVSPDGSLTTADYKKALSTGMLDFIAVTDHNEVSFALKLQRDIGDQIIVGEEIMTSEGEIIGLFLQERIESNLSPEETVARIKTQNGLVYIPHPFETVRRSGLSKMTLSRIVKDIDIVEIYNGRVFLQNKTKPAEEWAKKNQIAGAASSDAHGRIGWGKTYSIVSERPMRNNLTRLIKAAELSRRPVGIYGAFYPLLNKIMKHPHE